MTTIAEFAPAKVNLTLEIAGRRGDGLHEIRSLTTFASAGDRVVLDVGRDAAIEISGPFGAGLAGQNILGTALSLLAARAPHLTLGTVCLDKHLPIAAGLGGGSADAAALLRAVRRANPATSLDVPWHELAAALGADVPACLESRPLWVTGKGEELAEVTGGVPRLEAVLVNPLTAVPADKTARVFRALGAKSVPGSQARPPAPVFSGRRSLLDFMSACGNHLSDAAAAVMPEAGAVLAALRALPEIEYAAMSGAGPTCFGVVSDADAAEAARAKIAAAHPAWWVVATQLA
jgi:4-diphosphocytidyl-2-C-methyl-D-erythritol kinase